MSIFTTNEHITNYIIQQLNPSCYTDGSIYSIHDPVMGYGKFLLNSLKYLDANYPHIDWHSNQYRVSGYEINTDVYNIALQNIYQETGLDLKNIKNCDCIKMNPRIKDNSLYPLKHKYDIIMADLPQCIHYNQIAFLKYIMRSLNTSGRAAVIIHNKIITSNKLKYMKIRKYLVRNYNIHKLVSVTQDSNRIDYILFFTNTGRTNAIELYNLDIQNTSINYISTITFDMIVNNYYNYISPTDYISSPESMDISITPDSIDEFKLLENQMNHIII
jgi:type I restriction-modification system DNA methylase subunit